MKATVDIIVITWNGREDTLQCLDSLRPELESPDYEARVTVVDNGSIDGTADEVRKRFPSVRLLRLATNRGFTGGIKAGVDASYAEYVIFLNNDAVVENGWLGALVDAIRSAPADVVAVGGKIIDMSGSRVDFVGGLLTFDGHAFQRDFRKPLGEVTDSPAGSEMLFACGGNMIVKREPYLALGGFDDDYFAYLEDVDFGWRSWIAGWRATYAPSAVIRHKSSATSDRLGVFERGVLFERNALQTAVKNYEDDLLREASGAIFFAYLHRLHRYVMDRNHVPELARPPFEQAKETLLSRIAGKLRGTRARDAVIRDPLAAMQFRAFDWFLRNRHRIEEKRAAVQAMRKRSDREILERFPLHYVPTYHGDAELLSSPLFELLRPQVASRSKTLDEIMRR